MNPTRTRLDATRWHWQHGPIDLILSADGTPSAVQAAYEACWARFVDVLPELVGELPRLRQPVPADSTLNGTALQGAVARRMWSACHPHRARYITPMAAVAGSVAQELIAFYQRPGIRRAWVNNGGDIALHLAPGEAARVGVFADLARFDPLSHRGPLQTDGQFEVRAEDPVRGIATSGWLGRSFSLGIADSVTVLAASASQADAAATLIANAVDVQDAGIRRLPVNPAAYDKAPAGYPNPFKDPRLNSMVISAGRKRSFRCGFSHFTRTRSIMACITSRSCERSPDANMPACCVRQAIICDC